jgi:hypothetical protein
VPPEAGAVGNMLTFTNASGPGPTSTRSPSRTWPAPLVSCGCSSPETGQVRCRGTRSREAGRRPSCRRAARIGGSRAACPAAEHELTVPHSGSPTAHRTRPGRLVYRNKAVSAFV